MALALPTGRRGRLLAFAVTVFALVLAWFAVAVPLIDWYGERAARIADRVALARRMSSLAAILPELQRRAAADAATGPSPGALLDGANDAIAGATLQQRVQELATKAGLALTSTETLPASQAGAYRRIGLRIAANTTWSVLTNLLESFEQATPRMLVDDLQVRGTVMVARPPDPPLDVVLTVFGFRPSDAVSSASR